MNKRLKAEDLKALIENKGLAALAYAKESIKKGCTQAENNSLDPEAIKALETGMRDERNLYNQNLLAILEDFIVHFYEIQMSLTDKYSLGNCCELTNKALDYFITIDSDHIRAERFKIKNGDHVFLVINRPINSDPSDPNTWGEFTYICDPLMNDVYPAKQYADKLKAHHVSFENDVKKNEFSNFIPNYHKIINDQYFSTDYLIAARSAKNLKSTFIDKTENLVTILKQYKMKLSWIKMLTEFDETIGDLDSELSKLTQSILSIQQIIDKINKTNHDKYSYREMRNELATPLKAIIKTFLNSLDLPSSAQLNPNNPQNTSIDFFKFFKKGPSKRECKIYAAKNEVIQSFGEVLNKPIKC